MVHLCLCSPLSPLAHRDTANNLGTTEKKNNNNVSFGSSCSDVVAQLELYVPQHHTLLCNLPFLFLSPFPLSLLEQRLPFLERLFVLP